MKVTDLVAFFIFISKKYDRHFSQNDRKKSVGIMIDKGGVRKKEQEFKFKIGETNYVKNYWY